MRYDERVRFAYFRDNEGKPHATVAWQLQQLDDGKVSLLAGAAFCKQSIPGQSTERYLIFSQEGDQFTKARGRSIAAGRLEKSPVEIDRFSQDELEDLPPSALEWIALTGVFGEADYAPRWAREVAEALIDEATCDHENVCPNCLAEQRQAEQDDGEDLLN